MLGIAVDVDENVDLVIGNQHGGFFVGQSREIAPAIGNRAHAHLRLVDLHRFAAVIEIDLDGCLVMLLENFAQGKTDGMVAQVRGDVADADLLSSPRLLLHRFRQAADGVRAADQRAVIAMGLGQLEQRIVGIAGKRQRRHGVDHLAQGDVFGRRENRPLALALAKRAPVMAGIRLVGTHLDGLPEGCFGLFQKIGIFHHATGMLDRHQAKRQAIGGGICGLFGKLPPLLDRLGSEAAVFQGAAKVDMGLAEFRLKRQAGPESVDRAGNVADVAQRHGIVEIHHVQIGMAIVVSRPLLVEVRRLGLLARLVEAFANLEEIGKAQPLGACEIKDRFEAERCILTGRCVHQHCYSMTDWPKHRRSGWWRQFTAGDSRQENTISGCREAGFRRVSGVLECRSF